VWSLAWCPVSCAHQARQYLSVYTHRNAADYHVFEQPSHDPALIQVYDCGILSSQYESCAPEYLYTLKFIYLVACKKVQFTQIEQSACFESQLQSLQQRVVVFKCSILNNAC